MRFRKQSQEELLYKGYNHMRTVDKYIVENTQLEGGEEVRRRSEEVRS